MKKFNFNWITLLGIGATVLSAVSTMVSGYADDQKMKAEVRAQVHEALAEEKSNDNEEE